MCEVAHTSFGIGKVFVSRRSRLVLGAYGEWSVPCRASTFGAGACRGPNSTSALARRLGLERIEPLIISRATVAHSWFWRLVSLLKVGRDRGAPHGKRVRGSL